MAEYEAERLARIAENKRRMSEIGLAQASSNLHRATAPQQRRPVKRRPTEPAVRLPPSERRRSSRTEGKPAPNYNDSAFDAAEKAVGSPRRRTFDTLIVGAAEEKYTQEHVAMLGDCQQPWELFVDGYDAQGNRIYDKVEGQTCHQCRQKTMGKRTCCSQCQSLSGVFCGDCLFMRYGENVDEAKANPEWTCPHCRDVLLCNCSQHRTRRGWAPTGALYRKAIAMGFKSVAHYLVLNHVEGADDPQPTSPTDAQQTADVPPAPSTPPRDEDAGASTAAPASEQAAAAAAAAPSRTRQSRIDDAMPQRKAVAGRGNGAQKQAAAATKAAVPALKLAGGGKRVSAGPPAPETPPAARRRSCRLAA